MTSQYLPITANTILSRDILLEVILYYRLGPSNDALVQVKGAQLRALSLVSRQLHEITRPELWRTVWDIRHVRSYIELLEGENIIKSLSPWGLREPLLPETRNRVLELLSYTRNFAPRQWDSDDFINTWCFVTASVGLPHLFPNLKLLFLDWSLIYSYNEQAARKAHLALLASQTIEHVVHYQPRLEDRSVIMLLHNALRAQKAPISCVEISGWKELTTGILPLSLSTSAPTVSFNVTGPPSHRARYCDLFLALSSCPGLSTLTIKDFAVRGSSSWEFTHNPLHFAKLSRLEVSGKDLQYHKLFPKLDCPSLVSLTLHLIGFDNWRDTFTSMTSFQNLENVVVTVMESTQELHLEDLLSFLRELTIGRLRILGVESQLSEGDVTELLTHASTMRSLVIEGPKSIPLPLSVIQIIALRPLSCMEEICLPIDFTTPLISPTISPIHPNADVLRRLLIHSGSVLPQTMQSKIKVAGYIGDILPSASIQPLEEGSTFGSIVRDIDVLRHHLCSKIK
ncbi:hypothetical protein D9756_005193 [Leucocoprinus leucothites]|uniref:F-box domain-containing protein n=1 Tax=Leucocoprinus leucothites TaxID=201217 RepID=A0A8H5G9C0_9AGAR|nr:hypothetical protein D9756_005193 [Leucoagaricus leucothites]